MERQVIDALIKKQAELREQIRWREASIANTNPNYKDNKAYLDRIKAELATLRRQEFDVTRQLEQYSTSEPITSSSNPTNRQSTNNTVDPGPVSVADSLGPGETIVTAPEPQQVIDDGSDPYTSNGVSTIPRLDINTDPSSTGSAQGLQGAIQNTRATKTKQDLVDYNAIGDWRVRLSLAPGAEYLYKATNPGILGPLKNTNGIIFPYTPVISVAYTASYDASDIVHSNYKILQYKNSAVDSVSITCDFTAQDSYEAEYLLAVIHFLRSVTKMFYGKDQDPIAGTPPPMCYLNGLGNYQFNQHPLVITGFTYNLPNEVDYIRAYVTSEVSQASSAYKNNFLDPMQRLEQSNLQPGANPKDTVWTTSPIATGEPTYVPTKMQIQIQAMPIVSRGAVSNAFSVKDYATGKLLQGNKNYMNGNFGGLW